MSEYQYQVNGMTCGHCELSVREEVSEIPGVTTVDVSAATGRLIVGSDRELDDQAVIDAVEEAGYVAQRR